MPSCTSQPCPDLSCGPQSPTAHTAVWSRINGIFGSVIGWLRAGYPDEAPATGYSPLVALGGPIALTPQQTQRIVDDLAGASVDPIDIGVAITKNVDRLPTPAQTRAIAKALRPNSGQ